MKCRTSEAELAAVLATAVTGLILSGGRGSRMGGVDKGLQSFRGTAMVSHVIARLAPQVDRLMIAANQNLPAYRNLGFPVWPDTMPDFAGPLAGLQSGLAHCDTPYLVTAPCDSPFLPHDLVAQLQAALKTQDADLAIAVTGNPASLQLHPVFCLLKSALLPKVTDFLQRGGRRMDGWHAALNVAQVHFSDEAAFRNINTQEQLQELETNHGTNLR